MGADEKDPVFNEMDEAHFTTEKADKMSYLVEPHLFISLVVIIIISYHFILPILN